jgi:hypothetical protein
VHGEIGVNARTPREAHRVREGGGLKEFRVVSKDQRFNDFRHRE